MSDTWHELVEELFDANMVERWGWSVPVRLHSLRTKPPSPSALVELGLDGLKIPYFNGWVRVDFGAGRVICHGVDQKTPAEERWTLSPSDEWWARARACEWPL